jgi:hypothetical protein
MDAHRLVRDELLYEMRVRGLSDLHETVSTLRRKLSELLRTEAFGVLVTHDSFEPDLAVETQTCVEKVIQLSEFLSGRTAIVKGSNDERIVETRMKHLYGRCESYAQSGSNRFGTVNFTSIRGSRVGSRHQNSRSDTRS